MSASAWITFAIGGLIIWGGLIASIWNAIRKNKLENQETVKEEG